MWWFASQPAGSAALIIFGLEGMNEQGANNKNMPYPEQQRLPIWDPTMGHVQLFVTLFIDQKVQALFNYPQAK